MIRFKVAAASAVPTPPAGYATLFIDAATGLPAAKIDTDIVVPLKGDPGEPGPGLPAGGEPGQVVTKTAEGTTWATPVDGGAAAGTWLSLLPPDGVVTDDVGGPLATARITGNINLGGV
ncbi:hypothetical protein [Thermomonas fusca]